jgi:hypothetical protein
MYDNDIEIKEVETYTSGKSGAAYNYPTLVMDALKKCSDAGAKEMRSGYWNTKRDRVGNLMNVYVPDARFEFIECVENLKMVVSRDFDEDVEKALVKIKEALDKLFKDYCGYEEIYWNSLPELVKKEKVMKGIIFIKGRLSTNSFYYDEYLNEKVKVMRGVFEEISKLAKRNGDYQEELFEA